MDFDRHGQPRLGKNMDTPCPVGYHVRILGMLKAWFARKAIALKVPISENLTSFADAQEKFVDNVLFLGMVSDNVVPTMEMSPIEFEVYFDGLAKGKGLSLRLCNKNLTSP